MKKVMNKIKNFFIKANSTKKTKVLLMSMISSILLLLSVTFAWFVSILNLDGNTISTGTIGFVAKGYDEEGNLISTILKEGEYVEENTNIVSPKHPLFTISNWDANSSTSVYLSIEKTGTLDMDYSLTFSVTGTDESLQNLGAFWYRVTEVNEGLTFGLATDMSGEELSSNYHPLEANYSKVIAKYVETAGMVTVCNDSNCPDGVHKCTEKDPKTSSMITMNRSAKLGTLTAANPRKIYRIDLGMFREAYQERYTNTKLSISGEIYGTQLGALENPDGIGKSYTVTDESSLKEAMDNALPGDNIILGSNIELNGDLIFTKCISLYTNGKTLTVNGNLVYNFVSKHTLNIDMSGGGNIKVLQTQEGAGGDLEFNTPNSEVNISALNFISSIYVADDVRVDATNAVHTDGFNVKGTNILTESGEQQTLIVDSNTRLTVNKGVSYLGIKTVGQASNIEIINFGSIGTVNLTNMLVIDQFPEDTSKDTDYAQIVINNYNTIVESIKLPVWSRPFISDGDVFEGNTKIIRQWGASEMEVDNDTQESFFKTDIIDFNNKEIFVEEIDGDSTQIIVYYRDDEDDETGEPIVTNIKGLLEDHFSKQSSTSGDLEEDYVKGKIGQIKYLEIRSIEDKELTTTDISYINTNLSTLETINMQEAHIVDNTLPSNAFKDNKSIVNITLPDTLEIIGANSVATLGITQITVPASVTKVNDSGLTGVEYVTFEGSTKPTFSIAKQDANTLYFVNEEYLDVYRNSYANHSDKGKFYPKAEITDDGIHGVRKIEDGYELVFSLNKYSSDISVGSNISLNLQHIEITKVGTYAYYHLPQEMKISFDDSVKEIDQHAFRVRNILTLELNNVEVIQSTAFSNCTLLNSIDMGNVKYIGSYAFYNCTALKELNTKNVTEIDEQAFYNCTGLVVVECPNVVTIKDSAFYGLKNLVKVSFDKIKTIEANNFTNITNLEQVWFYNEESMEGFVCKGFVKTDQNNIYSIFTTRENYSIVYGQIKGYGLTYRYVGDISGTYNKTVNGVTVNLGEYIVDGDENNGAITSCNYDLISEDYEVPSELTCITRDGEEITKKIVEVSRVSYTTVAFDKIKITFPESIKTIGANAFEYWLNSDTAYRKKIHKIDFGGVEAIEKSAFSCKNSYSRSELIEIIMPNVKTIGDEVFYHANQLLLIEFGKIESIGTAAFTTATYAQQVVFYNDELIDTSKLLSLPYYGTTNDYFKSFKVFATSNNLTNIKNHYKNKVWSSFADYHFAEVGKKVGTYIYTRLNDPINLGEYMVKVDGNGNGCITSYIKRSIEADYEVPSELDEKAITSIGNYAYYSTKMVCDNLTFGDNITSIGTYAFSNALDNKTILNANFNNVETIGSRAFASNKNLEGIEFGNVQTIGTYAFQSCTGLIDIKLSNVNTVENYAFSGCSNIVSIDFGSTISLGDYAFQNLSSIEEIDFKNVESLGTGCFSGAKKLVRFNDDNKIKTLNQNSFGNCVSLVKAVFPELLTIGTSTATTNIFTSATSLVILDIGPNYNGYLGTLLTSAPNLHQFILRVEDFSQIKGQNNFYSNMGGSTNKNFRFYAPANTRSAVIGLNNYGTYFLHCSHILGDFYGDYFININTPNSGIQPVNIHEYCLSNYTFTSASEETFSGTKIQSINYEYTDADSWKNYRLPSEINGKSVLSIGYNSFRNVDFTLIDPINESNENFIFPDSVKEIYHNAFRGTQIRVSDLNNVERIEDYAFYQCKNIYIIESENLKYGGNHTFNGCTNLLKVNTPNLIEVGNSTFANCSKLLSLMTNIQKAANVSDWYPTTSLVELSYNTDPESTSTFKFGNGQGTTYIVLSNASSVNVSSVNNQIDITKVKKVGENWIDAFESDGVTKITGYSFNLGMYYINSEGDTITIYRILTRTVNEDLHIPSVLDDENPREVNSLGKWAFSGINFNNHQVYLPATAEVIGASCFKSSSIGGTLDLKNVTTVYESAFFGTNITNVFAPKLNNLSSQRIFYNCAKLEEAYLPNVTSIGAEVFLGCTSLKYLRFNKLPSLTSNINLREGITIILEGDITAVSQINTTNVSRWLSSTYTYVNASSLTFLVQYESLEYYQQTNLKNYNLSYYGELYEYDDGSGDIDLYLLEQLDSNNDGEQDAWTLLVLISSKETIVMTHTYNSLPITHIRANAFSSSSAAKSITLPKYYSYYEDKTLNSAISIQEVLVDTENTNFKSIDGVLYNYSLTELIAYPSKKINEEYIVNDGTLVIRSYAFYNVENLRHVVINKELLVLGSNVFDKTTLETIEFTSSTVPYITSSEVFDNLNLNLVIYVPDDKLALYQSVNAFQDYTIDVTSNKVIE